MARSTAVASRRLLVPARDLRGVGRVLDTSPMASKDRVDS